MVDTRHNRPDSSSPSSSSPEAASSSEIQHDDIESDCEPEWDPWGVPEDYECEYIENDAPVPKHIPIHRPGPPPEEFHKTLKDVLSNRETDAPAVTST